MNHMSDLGRGHSRFQPFFSFKVDIDRARARQCHGASDIVQQNLREAAIADRAKVFGWPDGGAALRRAKSGGNTG